MTDSKGSVVVSDQRALDGCADVVVVPDRGSERQDALPDPGEYAGWCSSAVLFQVELAFVGVEHRFDILPQWFEELSTWAGLFALAGGSKEVDTGCAQGGFEFLAVVVLVRDQGGTGDLVGQVGVVEHSQKYLAFIGFGAGDCGRDRQSVQRAQHVQPQTPEVAGVRGAVPVLGEAGQIRTLGGLPGTAALHWGGVGDPHVIAEHAGPAAQRTDQPTQGADQLAQALVVPGLPGQVREQVLELAAAEPQPAGLAGETEKGLRHSQCHQFGIADPGRDAHRGPPRHTVGVGLQKVIDLHVECGHEGVQIGVHAGLLLDDWVSNVDPGHPRPHVTSSTPVTPVTAWNQSSSEASPLTAEARVWSCTS